MKQLFFMIAGLISLQSLFGQEPADALRYSWYTSSGTARQQAVGGAMGSLGGDISATFVNPAGLGFYKTGDIVLTPRFGFLNNRSTYLSRTESDKASSPNYGASGIVFGGSSWSEAKKMRSSAISLAINRTADFRSNILYRGANSQSSYSQKFLEEISNGNIKDANVVAQNYPFGTSLAFNTYWIDTIAGGSTGNYQFKTRAPIATGLLQENRISAKGGITELALGAGANYRDKFFFGFTASVPLLHYERETTFTEADATSNGNNKFDYATFSDKLVTDGAGINLKFGILYKPVERVRLGFAIHSPGFFQLTDKYHASVTTNTETYQGTLTQGSGTFTGGQDAEFKYWLFTPYRLIASASYVLHEIEDVRKQKGFLTADIEFVNYKASSFTTDPKNDDQASRDYLKSLNRAIDKAYKAAFNFRVGGELKFTTIMARLGAAYYGNPYKNINGEKGSRLQLSGGLGYRNKGMFIDLTYVHTMGKDIHFPYRLQSTAYSGAAIKSTNGNIVLTVGFKI